MIGANASVLIEHLTQTRDSHGGKTDGAVDEAHPDVPASISRASLGNVWRMTVAGDWTRIGEAPSEWRIRDNYGRTFAPTRATYRPPIAQLGESEHSLLFAELQGEVDTGIEV